MLDTKQYSMTYIRRAPATPFVFTLLLIDAQVTCLEEIVISHDQRY